MIFLNIGTAFKLVINGKKLTIQKQISYGPKKQSFKKYDYQS